jgi:tripartite-type tricarboxylate transporter receptor subunit TctC
MVVPAKTPAPIVARLNAEVVKIMQSEDMKKRLSDLGANALSSTPDECRAFIQQEIVRWAKVVKDAGIKLN